MKTLYLSSYQKYSKRIRSGTVYAGDEGRLNFHASVNGRFEKLDQLQKWSV